MSQQELELEIKIRFYEAIVNFDVDTAIPLLRAHEFLRLEQHQENSFFQMSLRNHARETVKLFLNEDASLATKIGYTQAHQYAENGDLNNLIQLLKEQPQMLEATDSYANTPLHLAATHGHTEVIQYLHKAGSNLQANNADNNTPLQLALLFDKHAEKNAAKYIINNLGMEKNIPVALPFSQHHSDEIAPISLNPKKEITQENWNNLIQKYYHEYYGYHSNDGQMISVYSLLHNANYAATLNNIKIGSYYQFSDMDFSGVNFENCQFFGSFKNVKFAGNEIENSDFQHSYFSNAEFAPCTKFSGTSFIDTYFENTQFNQNEFADTLFSYVQFNNVTSTQGWFDNTFVSHSNLLGLTLNQPQNFSITLDDSVLPSQTVESTLHQLHFMNTDAPVIGLISSPYEVMHGGEIGMTAADPYARLKQYGAVPILLDMSSLGSRINKSELVKEINQILENIPTGSNIPKYLLSQQGENLDKIKAMADDYAKHLDAAWIPGGGDVNPVFYGKGSEHDHTYYSIRELFEFALIDHMVTHNKPLMGICHGSQITNVYFGGTLKEDVDGHHDDHLVIPLGTANTGVVSDIIQKPIYGTSNHHQSIDKLGEGLQVVAISGPVIDDFSGEIDYQSNIQTIIEASEGVNNKPIMLLQFHPEYNADDANKALLLKFVDLAKQSKQAHALELNDILASNQTLFADTQQEQAGEKIGQPLILSQNNNTTEPTAIYIPELNLMPEMHVVSPVV